MTAERPPRPLVVGSRSRHKVAELRRMLADRISAAELEVLDLGEAEARFGRLLPEVEEDGSTFAENAEKKARAVAELFGSWALADDSGLCVHALGGAPGVRSARFSGVDGERRDEANNEKLLSELRDVPVQRRGAAFVCALCVVSPDGEAFGVEGRCEGRIADAPRGTEGFGYDPLFISEEPGADGRRTHAELSAEEKDAVSHRGRALRAMRAVLDEAMGGG